MTIDPMAAVTTATSGAASPAANVDPAASANATVSPQGANQPAGADQGSKVDLFDYTSKQQNAPPAIDTLTPEGKAKYLANPAELGGKVLEKMESFHQRSAVYQDNFMKGSSSQPMAASGGDGVMGGPAQQHVAGTSKGGGVSHIIDSMRSVTNYAVETTMMTTTSSQFGKTVNTLMKGQ